jgi:DNA-damage-inducible protein J
MEKVKRVRYNKETLEAFREARSILNGELETKSYSSAKELFDEIEAEYKTEQRQKETGI